MKTEKKSLESVGFFSKNRKKRSLLNEREWDIHKKPLAAAGLTSYRYRGDYGWVMIGAIDNSDAMKEAGRSVSHSPSMDRLEKWDGKKYIPVTRKKTRL